ncbi:MAG TPA: DUF2959 family protein [Phycisphaerales bacterium]|nr:DUF2959 family protein [Phycisphaerales bacterium]
MATARTVVASLLLLPFVAAPGCNSAGIAMREKLGIPKREQLVDRVKDARESQQEAKQQFASALDEFMAVTGAKGGELESKFRTMQREFDRCEDAAAEVQSRISNVDAVATKLFSEWRRELSDYNDPAMRSRSERQLAQTQRQYEQLMDVMNNAASKMEPVLLAFRDRVLFLKHNLNAAAIASLQDNADVIQGDVSRLMAEMQASIDEADEFIEQMGRP